jgi:hypothetical protein
VCGSPKDENGNKKNKFYKGLHSLHTTKINTFKDIPMENWREKILSDRTGNKDLYAMSNDNGFRVVNLAMSGHLIVRSKFSYSKINLR